MTVEYRVDRTADPILTGTVVDLYDRGLLVKQIARSIGLSRAAVTAVLDARFAAEGRDRPDGRTRRATLAAKREAPPVYAAVADRVKALADGGRLFGQIAAELGIDRNTVTAAWRHWHASRGVPVPDGRGRRKTLALKSATPREEGGQP